MNNEEKNKFLKEAIKTKYQKDVDITCNQCAINLLFD